MFRYTLHWADGSEAGEVAYSVYVKPGDVILASERARIRRLRVLDLRPVDDWSSPYSGLLMVEREHDDDPPATGPRPGAFS
jgi:hypothetical protein